MIHDAVSPVSGEQELLLEHGGGYKHSKHANLDFLEMTEYSNIPFREFHTSASYKQPGTLSTFYSIRRSWNEAFSL